jgi:hypothetical protein
MRTVDELTQDELEELRESYFYQLEDTDNEVLGDNITSAEMIPMENIIAHYEGISFTEEDFFCNI